MKRALLAVLGLVTGLCMAQAHEFDIPTVGLTIQVPADFERVDKPVTPAQLLILASKSENLAMLASMIGLTDIDSSVTDAAAAVKDPAIQRKIQDIYVKEAASCGQNIVVSKDVTKLIAGKMSYAFAGVATQNGRSLYIRVYFIPLEKAHCLVITFSGSQEDQVKEVAPGAVQTLEPTAPAANSPPTTTSTNAP